VPGFAQEVFDLELIDELIQLVEIDAGTKAPFVRCNGEVLSVLSHLGRREPPPHDVVQRLLERRAAPMRQLLQFGGDVGIERDRRSHQYILMP
jgi:hypothetical protein